MIRLVWRKLKGEKTYELRARNIPLAQVKKSPRVGFFWVGLANTKFGTKKAKSEGGFATIKQAMKQAELAVVPQDTFYYNQRIRRIIKRMQSGELLVFHLKWSFLKGRKWGFLGDKTGINKLICDSLVLNGLIKELSSDGVYRLYWLTKRAKIFLSWTEESEAHE